MRSRFSALMPVSGRSPTVQRMKRAFAVAAAIAICGVGAYPSSSSSGKAIPVLKLPAPGEFVRRIDNSYLPLRPGTTFRYRGTTDGEAAEVTVEVTRRTKTILGVRAVVVLDRSSVGGKPEERTFDWYAQDKRGNVWYLGEDSFDFKQGKWVRNDGSWQAGVDGAKAGIVMKARPRVGETYRQEYYRLHAEDVARVLSTKEAVSVRYGDFKRVLETRDWSLVEPGVVEHKYFARGVGEVKSVMVKGGSEVMALVSVTRGS
jgi:hypothetical protein